METARALRTPTDAVVVEPAPVLVERVPPEKEPPLVARECERFARARSVRLDQPSEALARPASFDPVDGLVAEREIGKASGSVERRSAGETGAVVIQVRDVALLVGLAGAAPARSSSMFARRRSPPWRGARSWP